MTNGKILAADHAAEKLLGYSDKELLSKNFDEIFTPFDGHFKRMIKQRRAAGHATGDLTVIKKNGKQLPCQITSVVFTGDNHIQKAITTLVDRSEGILRQSVIDMKKEKEVAAEIIFENSKSDATITRLHNLDVSSPYFRAIRDQSFPVFSNSRETDFLYSTGGTLPSESWGLEPL